MQLPTWFKQLLWTADYQKNRSREVKAPHRRRAGLAVQRFEERRVLDATFALSSGVVTLDGFTDDSLSIQHDQMAGEYVFTLEAGSTWTDDPDGTTDNVARVADASITEIIVDASSGGMGPAPDVNVVVSALTANNSLATLKIGVAGGEVGDVNGDQISFVETLDIAASGDATFKAANDLGTLKVTAGGNVDIVEADSIELTSINVGGKFSLAAGGDVAVVKVNAENVDISTTGSITADDATPVPVISVTGASASISLTSGGDLSTKSGVLSIDAGGGQVSLTRFGTGDFLISQTGAAAHTLSFQDTGASGSIDYTGNAAVTIAGSSFEGSVEIDSSSLTLAGKVQGTGDITLGSNAAVTLNTGASVEASAIAITAGTSIEVDADDSSVELDASTITLTADSIGQAAGIVGKLLPAKNLNFSNATSLTIFKQAGGDAFLKETGKSSETNAVSTSIENKNTAGDISIEFATDMLLVDVSAGKHTLTTVNTTGAFAYDAGANAIADGGTKLSADALTLVTTGAVALGTSAAPLEVSVDNTITINAVGATDATGGVFLKSTTALNLGVIHAGTADAEFHSDVSIALTAMSDITAASIAFVSNSIAVDAAAELAASQLTLLGSTTATSIGVGDDSTQTAKISTGTLSNLGNVSKVVIGDAGLNATVEIREDDGLTVDTALVVRGKAVSINSNITTDGGFTIEGVGATTTVIADQTITETGAGAITIDDSVLISSGATLKLDTQAGNISITGDIEGVGGNGDAGLVAKSVSGDIALGDDPATDTIDGAGGVGQFGDVSATTSGEVSISGIVDANSLVVTAGSVQLRENITTLSAVNISGSATIDNDVAIVAGGSITTSNVAGAAAATHALSLSTATGAVKVGELGGGGKTLTTVALSGATVELGGDISADSTVAVTGATTLASNVKVTANNSNVQFNNAVDSSSGSETLQISAGSGDITFAAAIGGTKTVGSFNAFTTGDVALSGVKTSSGDIVVGASGSNAAALKLSGDYVSNGKAEFFATSAELLSSVSITAGDDNITLATTSVITALNAGDSEHGLTLNAGTGAAAIVDISATAIGAKDNHLDHLVVTANTATLSQVLLGDGESRTGGDAGTALELNIAGDLTLTQSMETTADASGKGGNVNISGSATIDNDVAIVAGGSITTGNVAGAAAATHALSLSTATGAVKVGELGGGGKTLTTVALSGATVELGGDISADSTVAVTGATTLASNVTVTANNSNVQFNNAVDSSSGSETLQVSAGSGDITFAAAIGGTKTVGSFNALTTGDVALSGVKTSSGDIVVGASGSSASALKLSGDYVSNGKAEFFTTSAELLSSVSITAGNDNITLATTSVITALNAGDSEHGLTLNAGTGAAAIVDISATAIGAKDNHLDHLVVTANTATLSQVLLGDGESRTGGDAGTALELNIAGDLTLTQSMETTADASGKGGNVKVTTGGATVLDATGATSIEIDTNAVTSDGAVTLGKIDSTAANADGVKITAGAADIAIDAVGTSNAISSLDLTGGMINFNGNIGSVATAGVAGTTTATAASNIVFDGNAFNAGGGFNLTSGVGGRFNIDGGATSFVSAGEDILFNTGDIVIAAGGSLTVTVDSGAGADKIAVNAISGPDDAAVTLDAGSGVVMVGALGASLSHLDEIDITGAAITLAGSIFAGSKAEFSGNTTVSNSLTINTAEGAKTGSIAFNGTNGDVLISNGSTLTLNSGAATTVIGDISAGDGGEDLTITSTGNVTLGTAAASNTLGTGANRLGDVAITTTADVTVNAVVSAESTTVTGNANTVAFEGDVSLNGMNAGGNALEVAAKAVTLEGAVNATGGGAISITGPGGVGSGVTLNGDIQTADGAITIGLDTTLGADVTIDSVDVVGGANISLANVNGSGQSLQVNAGTAGDFTALDVGDGVAVNGFEISNAAAVNVGAITTTNGLTSISDSFDASGVVDSSTKAIEITARGDSSGVSIEFGDKVDANGQNVVLKAANDIVFTGETSSTDGDIATNPELKILGFDDSTAIHFGSNTAGAAGVHISTTSVSNIGGASDSEFSGGITLGDGAQAAGADIFLGADAELGVDQQVTVLAGAADIVLQNSLTTAGHDVTLSGASLLVAGDHSIGKSTDNVGAIDLGSIETAASVAGVDLELHTASSVTLGTFSDASGSEQLIDTLLVATPAGVSNFTALTGDITLASGGAFTISGDANIIVAPSTGSDVNVTVAGGTIDWADSAISAVDTGQSLALSIDNTGLAPLDAITFGNVGNAAGNFLSSLTVHAKDGDFADAGAITTGGSIAVSGDVAMTGNVVAGAGGLAVLTNAAGGSGEIDFSDAKIDGGGVVSLNSGANAAKDVLLGEVGGTTAVAQLAVTTAGDVVLGGDITTGAAGDVDFTGASSVLLGSASTITTGNGDVLFNTSGDLDGNHNFEIATGAGAVQLGNVGAATAVEALNITGGEVTFGGALGSLASAGVIQQLQVTAASTVKFEDTSYNADGGFSFSGSQFQMNAAAQTTTFKSDGANISFLNGDLLLSKNASLQTTTAGTSAGNGDIDLQNVIGDTDGSGSINFNAGSADLTTGQLGDSANKDRISSVTLAGGTVNLNSTVVAEDFVSVVATGTIELAEDTEICTLLGDVALTGSIAGDADADAEDLTIVAGDAVALGVNAASTIGGAAGALGALDIKANSDVTVNGTLVAESVTIAGNSGATAAQVTVNGSATLSGMNAAGESLSIAGESIALNDAVTITAGGGNVLLTGAAAVAGNDVTLMGTVDVSAVIAASISIDSNFDDVLLSATGVTPHLVTNQGAITIGSNVTLATDISLQSNNGVIGGAISLAAVNGAGHALEITAGDGDFTASGALGAAGSQLNGLVVVSSDAVAVQSVDSNNGLTVTSSNTFTSNGKIESGNAAVSIRAENQVGAAITLNGLEANGSDVTLTSGGDIVFLTNAVTSTGAGKLTLEGTTAAIGIQFGHDAGVDGVVDISLASLANIGLAGAGFDGGIVLGRSDQAGLIELGQSGDISLTQGVKVLAGDKLGAGANVTVTGNVSADAGFEIDGSGTTTVSLAGDVSTSNAAIDIDSPVQLTADGVELRSAGGDVLLDTVDADNVSRSLLIDAGAGDVTVQAIGSAGAVVGGVSISGSTINVANVDTSSVTADDGGAVTLTGTTINLNSSVQTSGKLNGGNITIDGAANLHGNFSADTGVGNGTVTFTGDISSVTQAETFTINVGSGDVVLSGDISAGQFQISSAHDVSVEGVNSNREAIAIGAVGDPVDGVLSLGGDLASGGADISLFAQSALLRNSIQFDSTGVMSSGDISLGTVDVPGLTTVGDVGLSLIAGDGEIDLGGATVNGLDHFNLSATTVTLTAMTLGDGNQNAINPGDALHVDAATRLTVAGDISTGGGGVNLTGDVDGIVLNKAASSLVIIATAGGDISMGDLAATASGDTDGLQLDAGTGDVTVGNVGLGGSLASLEINADAARLQGDIGTTITAGVAGLTEVASTGNVVYLGGAYHSTGGLMLSAAAHQISGDTSFLSANGDIAFDGVIEQPVDGAESDVTITATAGAVTAEAIGRSGKSDIGAVKLSGGSGVSLGGNVWASSFIVTGDATLQSDVTVDTESLGGDIQFSASIDGANQLSLHAVDGDVRIGGATGGNTRLASLTVETGQTLLLGGSVLLDGGGDIDFGDVKLLDVDDSLTEITFDTDADLGVTNAGRALLFSAAGDPFVETGLAVTIDTTVNGTGADAAITLAEMDVRSLEVDALSIVAQKTLTRGVGTGGGDIALTATGAGQVIEIQGDLDTSQSVSNKAGVISLSAANGSAVLDAGGATVSFNTDAALEDADITLDVAIDGVANEAFTLSAGGAVVDVNGALGAGGRLGLLTVNAGAAELGADVVASGVAISGETSIDIDAAGVQIDTGGVDSFFQSSSIDNTGADAEIRGGGAFVYRGNTAADAISVGGAGAKITTAAVAAINAGAGVTAIESLQIGHADNQSGTIVFNETGTLQVNASLLIEADDASVEINDDISILPAGSSLKVNAATNSIAINTSGAGITLTATDGLIDINSSVTGEGKDLTLVAGSGDIQLGADAAGTVGELVRPLGNVSATTTGDVTVNAAVFAESVSIASADQVSFENQVVLNGSTAGGHSLHVQGSTIIFQTDATVQVQSTGGNVFVGGAGVGSSLSVLSSSIENQAAGGDVVFDNQFGAGVILSAGISTTGGEVAAGSSVTLTDDVAVDTTLTGSAGANVTFTDVDADATATATNLARQFKVVAGSGAIELEEVGSLHAFTRGADATNVGGVNLQGGAVTVGSLSTSNGAVNGAGGDVKIDSASAEVGDIATSGNGKASGAVNISTSAGDAKLANVDTSNAAAGTAVAGQAAGGNVLIDVTDGNLTLNHVATSGDNAGSGSVELTATGAVGGGISVAAGVDTRVLTGEGSGGAVTIDATDDLNLTGDVLTSAVNGGTGGAVSLKADGLVTLTGDVETQGANGDASGNVVFNDAGGSLTLGADTTITTASSGGGADGNVSFNGLVDASAAAAQSLTVVTGTTGVTTFDDEVGSLRSLSGFQAVGDVKITDGVSSFTVDKTQQFDGEVSLSGIATSLTKLVADTVQFNGAVNADAVGLHQLEIDADLELNADIGDSAALNALTVTGDSSFNGSAGAQKISALTQDYSGSVTLAANTELTGSDITFQQAVDGAHSLLIDASAGGVGTGVTRLLQTAGGVTALTSIGVNETLEAGTAGGAAFQIVTTGSQSFDKAVLNVDTTFQSGGDIRFDGLVQSDGLGTHDLTVEGQGGNLVNDVTFAEDLGQTGSSLGDVTQLAGRGVTTFSGGVIDGQLAIATVNAVLDSPSAGDTLFVNGGDVSFELAGSATLRSGLNAGGGLVTFDVNRAGGSDSFVMETDAFIATTHVSNRAVQVLVNEVAGGDGDATLGSIQATSGGVVVDVTHATGAGAVGDGNGASDNISARQIALLSTSGIGDADAIETRTALLAVHNSSSGAIQISNTSDATTGDTLTIGEVREDAPGAAVIANGLTQNGTGNLSVTTSSVLSVEETVTSGNGGADLRAGGVFDLLAEVTTGGGDANLESGDTFTVLADVTTTGGGNATFVSAADLLLGDNTLTAGVNETVIATNGGGDATFNATGGNIEVRSHISNDQGDISFDANRDLLFASAGDGADVVTDFAQGGRIFGNAGSRAGRAIPGHVVFSNGATLDSGSGVIGDAAYRVTDKDVVTVTTVTTPSVASDGTAKIHVILNDPALLNAEIYVDWADRADAGQSQILYPPVTNGFGGGINDIRLDGNNTSAGSFDGGAGPVTHELSYQYRRGNPNDVNPFANIVIQVIVRPDHRSIPGGGAFGINSGAASQFSNASELRSQSDLQNRLTNGIILSENGRIVEFNSEVELTVPSQGLFAAITLRDNVVQVSASVAISRTSVVRVQSAVSVVAAQEFLEVVQTEDAANTDEAKLYFTEVFVDGTESRPYEVNLSLLKDGKLEQLFKTFRNGLYKIQYKAAGAEKIEVLFQLRIFDHKIVPVQLLASDAEGTSHRNARVVEPGVRIVSVQSIDHLRSLLRSTNLEFESTDPTGGIQTGTPDLQPDGSTPETSEALETNQDKQNNPAVGNATTDKTAEASSVLRRRRPVLATGAIAGLFATADGVKWNETVDNAISRKQISLSKHARLARKLRK